MRYLNALASLTTITLLGTARAAMSQTPVNDPSTRLSQVLPAAVAARVSAVIAKARSLDLPADALANRALKFAVKGVQPDLIEKSVAEQEVRMENVRGTLQSARGRKPSGDEVEAGAEAMRKGLGDANVSALARSAPSGRSLAVPLYVIGSLVDRGLSSDSALKRVEERLNTQASDRDLEKMPNELPLRAVTARGNRAAETGRELAETKRPGSAAGAGQSGGSAGGPPAGVPANGGAGARPNTPPGLGNKPGRKP